METWIKQPDYQNLYTISKEFNGVMYCVSMIVYNSPKSVKYWPHISSGKKRKDLEIFEEKAFKSANGLTVLFWIRESIFSFPKFFKNKTAGKREYFCIGWADSRRRNIYQRLQKEGFQFMVDEGRKILMKKL